MQTTIAERSSRLLSLGDFAAAGSPEPLGPLDLAPPAERQYILRMVLRAEHSALLVPAELAWLQPLIDLALEHQAAIGTNHPFVYATVRHGVTDSVSDDEWHVDGFSMKVPHVPEQNYVWCSHTGTEHVPTNVAFPADFDPLRHNVHRYLGDLVDESTIETCEARSVFCMDPYLLHRRPAGTAGVQRTFVRLSFVPIEIDDVHQTQNPLLPRRYAQDGVAFRNRLAIYPAAA